MSPNPCRGLAWVLFVCVTSVSVRGADLKPYRVGYNSWIGSIAFFVAQEKGFFREEGLDVKASSFSSPGDSLVPLLSGDIDAALSTADSVITVLDKAPGQLKIVYLTDTSAGADAIVARKDIPDVRAMRGRTVATTIGQCNQLLLEKALASAGLSDSDISLINMNADDSGAAFAAGKLDVAVTWEPWVTKVAAESRGHVIFSSADTPNLILDILAISSGKAQRHPQETRAFLRGLNRGYAYVQQNTDDACAIAGRTMEQKAAEVKAMLPKVALYSPQKNIEVIDSGAAARASNEVAAFFLKEKVDDTLVDVAGMYDSSYLK